MSKYKSEEDFKICICERGGEREIIYLFFNKLDKQDVEMALREYRYENESSSLRATTFIAPSITLEAANLIRSYRNCRFLESHNPKEFLRNYIIYKGFQKCIII